MNAIFIAAACVLAASLLASGVVLRKRDRVVSALLLATGASTAIAGALYVVGAQEVGAIVLAAGVLLPGGMTCFAYPKVTLRDPVEFVVFVTVAAIGFVALVNVRNSNLVGDLVMVGVVTLGGLAWWRYERGDDEIRRAVLWLSLAACTAGVVVGHVIFLFSHGIAEVAALLMFALVAPALVVGLRRPELFDVRGLIVQVIVFWVSLIAYIAVFVGVVALLEVAGDAAPRSKIGALALLGGMLAAGFNRVRVLLRGVVDEILFGARPNPLEAATRVADRVGDDPALALQAIREALVLPYASLRVGGVALASAGTVVTHTRTFPLALAGDEVGEVVVGLRPGDLTLPAADERVLRIVAPLLAQTLRTRALAADLQESREQSVANIEEERRRLRRDLHDGLGPTLSGIAFVADAARNTLRVAPDTADELLRGLRADTVAAVGEIRRIVYAMRPPALDELGLLAALRQQASLIGTSSGTLLQVDFATPEALPALPAAIEVAAYRIVLEALTNAARHSGTDSARVRLEVVEGALLVEVRDRGRTVDGWIAGVGLSSMRERAVEVGGDIVARGGPDGGMVEASLPLAVGTPPAASARASACADNAGPLRQHARRYLNG